MCVYWKMTCKLAWLAPIPKHQIKVHKYNKTHGGKYKDLNSIYY